MWSFTPRLSDHLAPDHVAFSPRLGGSLAQDGGFFAPDWVVLYHQIRWSFIIRLGGHFVPD